MRLCLYITLLFAVTALAQDYFEASCQYEGRNVQCVGGAFCAVGEGSNGNEARKDAFKKISLQVSASISVLDSSVYKQKESVSNRRYASESEEKVSESVLRSNLENVSLKTFDQKTVKNKVNVPAYVCKSDVAGPYLESLRIYKESLKALRRGKLDKDACGKAGEIRKKTMGLETALGVWGQVDKALQREYEKIYEEIEKDCDLEASKKIHWNPEKQTAYSDMAFSKLSESIEMEKSPCKDKDISLIYKDTEPECKSNGGPYVCSYQPSLIIASCEKQQIVELQSLVSLVPLKGFGHKKENALQKLQETLSTENFWKEWKHEIKQRSPQ